MTSLYFHCRPGPSIRFYHLSVLIPGPDPQRITLACLDYRDIEDAREEHFKPPLNRLHRTDRPGLWRARILSRRHAPKKAEKDPFLVALAIALAQDRRRAAQPLPSDSSFTVGLSPSRFAHCVISLRDPKSWDSNPPTDQPGVISSLRFAFSVSGTGYRGQSISTSPTCKLTFLTS